jgi:hypothetical protein
MRQLASAASSSAARLQVRPVAQRISGQLCDSWPEQPDAQLPGSRSGACCTKISGPLCDSWPEQPDAQLPGSRSDLLHKVLDIIYILYNQFLNVIIWSWAVLRIRSEIRCLFWPPDPGSGSGMEKCQRQGPGSEMNISDKPAASTNFPQLPIVGNLNSM